MGGGRGAGALEGENFMENAFLGGGGGFILEVYLHKG